MKKLRMLICTLLSLGMLLCSFACTTETVAAPSGFTLSDSYQLSWFSIPEARRYQVEITRAGAENEEPDIRTVSRTSVGLEDLKEGYYSIRVRSVTGRNYDVYSEWSETVEFDREHESGILYESANGNTEYTVAGVSTSEEEGVLLDLVIDEFYRKKPVTSVKLGAFRGNESIRSVKLSEGIVSIGNRAFYNCINLEKVEFPETLSVIGTAAFQSCTALTEVVLPDSVTSLDLLTFGYCTSLERVAFGENLSAIGDSVFYSCTALQEVVFPDSLQTIGDSAFALDTGLQKASFGSGIRFVGSNAFRGSALSGLEFSELSGELALGDYCFAETALKKAELPEKTTSVGLGAFYDATDLNTAVLPDTVTEVCAYAFGNTALCNAQSSGGDGLVYVGRWLVDVTPEIWSTVVYLGGEDAQSADPEAVTVLFREETVGIADQAFVKFIEGTLTGCPELYRIEFPSSLRYLGAYCFAAAPQLQRVRAAYEDSLVSTGLGSFMACVNLTNVVFSRGLQRIAENTFLGCTELANNETHPEYLTPETVTSVGSNAFEGTKILKAAETDGVAYAGNWLVGYDRKTYMGFDPMLAPRPLRVDLPENIVGIADYALAGCVALREIDLTGVRHLGRSAFSQCASLSLVTFDYNLLEIPAFAFYACGYLHHVDFPIALRKIGRYAFYLDDITTLNLSQTFVTEIGDHAFYASSNMIDVRFPNTLQTIGGYAFFGCDSIRTITIPDSVTEIGERAFADCRGLATVRFGGGVEKIGAHAFRGCLSLTGIDLPDPCTEVGEFAFYQCAAVTSLDLGKVERIGKYAFSGLSELNDLVIPASVTTVGDAAFYGCTLLNSVTFAARPAYVGANAFYGSQIVTMFCPFGADEIEWNPAWNIGLRPVVWGVELSEEGYVVSVECKEGAFSNPYAIFGISDPVREGYRFAGWSEDPLATEAEYSSYRLHSVPSGTKLYAVWEPAPEEPLPEDPVPEEDPLPESTALRGQTS